MGERDKPHSYRTSPQPRGKLLTHGHGDEELDGEVDEEVQPGEETAARSSHGAAVARSGEERRRPLGAAALGPSSSLEMVVVWRRFSTPRRLPGRRKIRGMGLLPRPRVSSLIWTLGFPSPPFRVPPKRAYRPRPNSDWADLGLKIFVWKIVTTFFLI